MEVPPIEKGPAETAPGPTSRKSEIGYFPNKMNDTTRA